MKSSQIANNETKERIKQCFIPEKARNCDGQKDGKYPIKVIIVSEKESTKVELIVSG